MALNFLLFAITLMIPIILAIIGRTDLDFYKKIDEGHVGVYYQGGAILPGIVHPGYHSVVPLITNLVQIPVGMQTMKVENVPCGTNGGVVLHFQNVEVVFRLNPAYVWETIKAYSVDFADIWIRNPVHHEVNQICSALSLHEVFISRFSELDEMLHEKLNVIHQQHLRGVEIVTVRFSKPVIPEKINEGFIEVAQQSSRLKTVVEQEANVLRSAEKEKSLAIMEALKLRDLSEMSSNASLVKVKQQASIQTMSVAIAIASIREQADATFYGKMKEAEANEYRLTPQFLDLQRHMHLMKNTEVYWGERIPESIVLDSVDHSVLRKVSQR